MILISETALNFLDTEELQGLVAHEIGHEYVWASYQIAKERNNHRQLQELELYCDGMALLTLARLGLNPSRLGSGLEKIERFNRESFGAATDQENYPLPAERKKFAQALIAWLNGAQTSR